MFFFFFQAEDGIRDYKVTGVQTCALPICVGVAGVADNVGAVTGSRSAAAENESAGSGDGARDGQRGAGCDLDAGPNKHPAEARPSAQGDAAFGVKGDGSRVEAEEAEVHSQLVGNQRSRSGAQVVVRGDIYFAVVGNCGNARVGVGAAEGQDAPRPPPDVERTRSADDARQGR